MQPRTAPIDRSVFKSDAGLVRFGRQPWLLQRAAVGVAVQHLPISTASVEAAEPVLAEIQFLVLHRIEAEHAEARPKKPAFAGMAHRSKKILVLQRGEGIVGSR